MNTQMETTLSIPADAIPPEKWQQIIDILADCNPSSVGDAPVPHDVRGVPVPDALPPVLDGPPDIILKTCDDCGETKSTHEFGADRRNDDGLQHTCKSCVEIGFKRHAWNNYLVSVGDLKPEQVRRSGIDHFSKSALANVERMRLMTPAHSRMACIARAVAFYNRYHTDEIANAVDELQTMFGKGG